MVAWWCCQDGISGLERGVSRNMQKGHAWSLSDARRGKFKAVHGRPSGSAFVTRRTGRGRSSIVTDILRTLLIKRILCAGVCQGTTRIYRRFSGYHPARRNIQYRTTLVMRQSEHWKLHHEVE